MMTTTFHLFATLQRGPDNMPCILCSLLEEEVILWLFVATYVFQSNKNQTYSLTCKGLDCR